jgi:hypothetical protein
MQWGTMPSMANVRYFLKSDSVLANSQTGKQISKQRQHFTSMNHCLKSIWHNEQIWVEGHVCAASYTHRAFVRTLWRVTVTQVFYSTSFVLIHDYSCMTLNITARYNFLHVKPNKFPPAIVQFHKISSTHFGPWMSIIRKSVVKRGHYGIMLCPICNLQLVIIA